MAIAKDTGAKTILIFCIIMGVSIASGCRTSESGTSTAVKPRYHHSWYKNHVYKKKWRVGRIKFEPEKQGVRKVKMKN